MSISRQFAFNVPLNLSREFINLLQGIFPPLILQDQDCFAGEAGAEELLALLPAGGQLEPLRKKWKADPNRSSEEKWDDIKNQVKINKAEPFGVSHPPLSRGPTVDSFALTETPLGRDGRHRPPIHLASNRRRSLETSQPFAQSTLLRPPKDRSGLCARGSDED